jgi:DNA polymerase III delta prime subunit
MDYSDEQFLWTEKYRPKKIADCILPSDLKATFQQFVDDKNVPNLLLSGRAGVGKTTVARALLDELGCDYMVINGSLNGNIDTLRNEISAFASSVSFSGGRKYVILDEADYLNANSTQPALRNFMEQFSRNCGFILTCNFKNRIIEPLHSRCSVIEFKIDGKQKPKLASDFFKRTISILKNENINYDQQTVVELITKFFPDWRRVLNELQRYSATGTIDSGILANQAETTIKELVEFMKDKNFTSVRKWVAEHVDIEAAVLFRQFYDNANQFFQPGSIPQLVLILANYQYKAAFVADHEINLAACMTEIMVECQFK